MQNKWAFVVTEHFGIAVYDVDAKEIFLWPRARWKRENSNSVREFKKNFIRHLMGEENESF